MKKKPIIIALVGASGSGKTTLSLYLQDKLAIPAVCSYTTRPMRPGEVNGREHWFVTEAEYERMVATESLLAYTKFGGYHYWTLESQVAKNLITTYVIDEKGLIELKNKWGEKYEVFSIYITRPNTDDIEQQRKDRDNERVQFDDYDVALINDRDLNTFLRYAITTIAKYLQ